MRLRSWALQWWSIPVFDHTPEAEIFYIRNGSCMGNKYHLCKKLIYFVCVQTGREAEEKPAWSVLRDDFMMGASMKDWDKESDEEGGEEEAPGGAEDYNSESD